MNGIIMLSSFDFAIAISLAICYNLFAHCITGSLYENKDYNDKYMYSVTTLMILGIMALVASKLISNRIGSYTDSVLSMGLGIAGLLLIITSVLIDWQNLNEITQVLVMGVIIIGISYYVYRFC
jgi:hypothetical protein